MNNIEKQVHLLQSIKPDSACRARLQAMTRELPDLRPHMPLVVFRLALAGVTLLLLGSLGTGILLAAKGSNPGSVLYPLKQVVDTHHVPFFSVPVASPTTVPQRVPYDVHHAIQAPHEQENEQEGHVSSPSATDAGTESIHSDVKGVSVHQGDEEKVRQTVHAPSTLQEIPPADKLHVDDEAGN